MKYFWLSLLLLLTSPLSASPYYYEITRVVDGDTVEFRVDWLPKELGTTLKLRIYGVDTPEKASRAKCAREGKLGAAATKFTTEQIYNAESRYIVIRGWDKYGGRVLGDLILDGVSLRDLLIKRGHARPYEGDAKTSWCK